MTSFRLNVSKLTENIATYRKYKSNTVADLDTIYGSLKNVESGWRDGNAQVFLSRLTKDKYDIDVYFKNLDFLYNQVEMFKNNVANLLASYGYNSNGYLKYDDNYYDSLMLHLNNAIGSLQTALQYLNNCNFTGYSYEIALHVTNLRNEINKLQADIGAIISNSTMFRNSINKIISDARTGIDRVSALELNVEKMKYNWKVNKDIKIDKISVSVENNKNNSM